MDVQKNSKSSVDREENERLSFGGSATQKTTKNKNPPIKLRYFGHVMRAKGSLGQISGKPRKRWLDSIKEATGLHLEVL
jgi:hypothetical protein